MSRLPLQPLPVRPLFFSFPFYVILVSRPVQSSCHSQSTPILHLIHFSHDTPYYDSLNLLILITKFKIRKTLSLGNY